MPDGRGASCGAVRREALPTFVLLGIVPLLVYVASYTGRMPGELIALPWDPASVWRGIWEHQRAMLDFHTELGGDHPYQSPPWSWPLLQRPVAYWFGDEGGAYREILALGNPLAVVAGAAGAGRPGGHVVAVGLGAPRPGAGDPGRGGLDLRAVADPVGRSRARRSCGTSCRRFPFLCLALACFAAWAWDRVAGRVAAVALRAC